MDKVGSCGSPEFSPDGKQLAFVCALSGSPQVWSVATEGGWPSQLTALEYPVGALRWSPDGKWLAFTVAPGGGMNMKVYLMRRDGTSMRRITPGGREMNNAGVWSRDSRWLASTSNHKNPRSLVAYVFDVTTGESTEVADLEGTGVILDFSSGRKQAVITRLRGCGSNDVYARNLTTGRETLLTPHQGTGSFGAGVFSPDGSTVYLSSNRDRDRTAFAKVKASGGPIDIIAGCDDADLGRAAISRDGRTAALIWNASGRSEMAFVDLSTGKLSPGPKLHANGQDAVTELHDLCASKPGTAQVRLKLEAPRDISAILDVPERVRPDREFRKTVEQICGADAFEILQN